MLTEIQRVITDRLAEINLLRRLYRFSEQEAIDFIEFCERVEVAHG